MDEGIVYLNGEFVPESQAKVSVFDRGFNGGEGVYDVIRTFGHKPFKLREHIQRLYRSLKYTRIDCGLSPEEMERLSLEVLDRNKQFLGSRGRFCCLAGHQPRRLSTLDQAEAQPETDGSDLLPSGRVRGLRPALYRGVRDDDAIDPAYAFVLA